MKTVINIGPEAWESGPRREVDYSRPAVTVSVEDSQRLLTLPDECWKSMLRAVVEFRDAPAEDPATPPAGITVMITIETCPKLF